MRTYDFSPLFRSTIGFDRLFDLAETAQRGAEESYPPYNIERLAEDRYQITLAVAGFSPDEISITAEQNVVTIEGGKTEKAEREFLYRGISTRALQTPVQPGRLRPGQERVVRQRSAEDRTGPGDPRGHEAAADRHQRRGAGQRAPDRSPRRPERTRIRGGPEFGLPPTRLRMEETMRPTTATRRQRLRLSSAPAPRHRLRAPQGRGDASVPDAGREAGNPRLLGFRRFGDRLLSCAARSGRTEGARQHRRHPRSLMRTRWRPTEPARRKAAAPLFHGARAGGLRRGIVQWKKISEYPDT